MILIPTTYIDKFGSVDTTIINDEVTLTLTIDNTKFISKFYDDFVIEQTDSKPERFSLNNFNELTDCRLLSQIPLSLLKNGADFITILTLDIELNRPTTTDHKTMAVFSLTIDGKQIITGKVQNFESGLDLLKDNLPENYKLKCCYSCAFSDYSVYGQGLFGTMLCFKNIKDEYLKVNDKDEYMDIMENHDRLVQETFLCSDFHLRKKGTGYRG